MLARKRGQAAWRAEKAKRLKWGGQLSIRTECPEAAEGLEIAIGSGKDQEMM